MTVSSLTSASIDGATRRRILFVSQARPGDDILVEFGEPLCGAAICQSIQAGTADVADGAAESSQALECLLLTSASGATSKPSARVEGWLEDAGDVGFRFERRDLRIIWRPGRAVIEAPQERMTEALAALAEFAIVERHVAELEQQLVGDFPTARADVHFAHRVDLADLTEWPRVNEMTRRSLQHRLRHADLSRCLQTNVNRRPPAIWRIVQELFERAELEDRLEALGDRIEVVADIYESANDRLSEYSYFRREYKIELWIVVILIAELLVMFGELIVTWRSGG
jgi:hypothetical protein